MNYEFDKKQTVHTQKGFDLFVAVPKVRVDKETFKKFLKIAKENNGYYSRYSKGEAIAGYQFKNAEDRDNFIEQINESGIEPKKKTQQKPTEKPTEKETENSKIKESEKPEKPKIKYESVIDEESFLMDYKVVKPSDDMQENSKNIEYLNDLYKKLKSKSEEYRVLSGRAGYSNTDFIRNVAFGFENDMRKIKKLIIHLKNLVKCKEKGGNITDYEDQHEVKHKHIPNFENIETEDIVFDRDKILIEDKPEYIPDIDKHVFERKSFIFDAMRIGKDKYLLATCGFDYNIYEKDNNDVVTFGVDKDKYSKYKDENYFIVTTLDQLVLTNLYYIERKKAENEEEAKEKTKKSEQFYDELPERRREAHLEQNGFYNALPAKIKKKISREKYESLSWQEKELIYKPYKRYNAKRIKTSLREGRVWVSYHKMYERFINKKACLVDKKGNPQCGLKKSYGVRLYVNPEVSKSWEQFRTYLDFKLKDIKAQREDYSDMRNKALETSFGFSGVNASLKEKYGFLVKHQDGSEITAANVEQIMAAIERVYSTFGNLRDKALKYQMKISHTQKTFVFASKAVGMYVPMKNAIAVSDKFGNTQFNTTFSHEVGHWIDHMLGDEKGKRYMSDDYESLAGRLAFGFRNNMNQKSNSDYVNATKECFARALEQYFAIENYGKEVDTVYSYAKLDEPTEFFNQANYVSESYYNQTLKPQVEKLLKESSNLFGELQDGKKEPAKEPKENIKPENKYLKSQNKHDELLEKLRSGKITESYFDKAVKDVLKDKEKAAKEAYPVEIITENERNVYGIETGGVIGNIHFPKGTQEEEMFFKNEKGMFKSNEVGKKIKIKIAPNSYNWVFEPTKNNIDIAKSVLEENGYTVKINDKADIIKETKETTKLTEKQRKLKLAKAKIKIAIALMKMKNKNKNKK